MISVPIDCVRPGAKRTMANKVEALYLMMKMIATPVPDLDQWKRNRDHPLIADGMLAQDNSELLNFSLFSSKKSEFL